MIFQSWLASLRSTVLPYCALRTLNAARQSRSNAAAYVEFLEPRVVLTTIDLANPGNAGTVIFGAKFGDQSGYSVSKVGDVNGDGFDDVLIGAQWANRFGNANMLAGETYVVFGTSSPPATVDLANLGQDGITIFGVDGGDESGFSVSGAGDVNGDGFDDVLIGAFRADGITNREDSTGEGYIVFGGSTLPETIDLEDLGKAGVTIVGIDRYDSLGFSVGGAGDVNGDGFDDVILGAMAADGANNSRLSSGESYVVFGGSSLPETILLVNLGNRGITINGENADEGSGTSVSGVGDVNGDGFGDLIVGAPGAASRTGKSYVIFGASSLPAVIDLDSLSTNGIAILGADWNGSSGVVVASAGDVNGDGFGDILISAPASDGPSGSMINSGQSYVVFGGSTLPSTINLGNLGGLGITIFGAKQLDGSGRSISGAGDVNGDGFDDVFIGTAAGATHLVFGGSTLPGTIDLAQLGAAGITIFGANPGDHTGHAVSGTGDVNGDGFSDLLIGACLATPPGDAKSFAGQTYLLLGGDHFTNSVTHLGTEVDEILGGTTTANVINGAGGNDTLIGNGGADVIYGGEGNDVVAISDILFQRLDGGNGSDTLRIDGASVALNLTTVAGHKLTSIETIDLRGSGANSLVLNALEVFNLSSNSNPSRTVNTLTVRRDAEDTINTGIGWTRKPNTIIDGVTYNAFQSGVTKLLLEALPITIDLTNLGAAGTTFFGADEGDRSGFSVSGAGDINGDGFDDLLIGALHAGALSNARTRAGESYVIFGGMLQTSTVDLSRIGTTGITILGVDSSDYCGASVSGAGDVNGDGFDDLLIGALKADASGNGTLNAGESYLIFGGASLPSTIDLSDLGAAGMVIFGADAADYSGNAVSSAGDVNGDGFDDLLIGATCADASGNGKSYAGESYLIYGAAELPPTLSLASLNMAGLTIFGADMFEQSGFSVTRAGDVNGDGFDDVMIGASAGSSPGRSNAGECYVIFGGRSLPTTIDLGNLGAGGFTILGADTEDQSGISVSSAGDLNGDGYDDLLIGAFRADASGNGKSEAGESYVIFGKGALPTTIDLGTLGTAGITIVGADSLDQSGKSVSGVGDVNGDGFNDLLVGAPQADTWGNSNDRAGESYLIFGGISSPTTIDLSQIGTGWIAIYGIDSQDRSGRSVSAAGDVNGDGFDDLLIGAYDSDAAGNSKPDAGESYLIFGSNSFTSSITHLGTAVGEALMGDGGADGINGAVGSDTLIGNGGADVIYGGEGDDVLAVSDLGFQRVDGGNGSDTLRLDGAGVALSLTTLADNKLTSIETIDVRGSGANSLALNVLEVLNITSGSSSARSANTLTVRCDHDDVVNIGTGWTQSSNVTIGNALFQAFAQGQARLLVEIAAPLTATLSGGKIVVTPTTGAALDVVTTRDTTTQEIVVRSLTANVVTAEFRFPIASVTGGLDAVLSPLADHFDASLAGLPVTVNGGDGNDSLTGGTANDQLSGGDGDDTLTGGSGQDTLEAGAGGLDLLFEILNADLTITPSQLTATGSGNTIVDALSGFEKALILGGGSANRLDASLSGIPVTMFGGAGNDVLIGGNQADSLDGQGGNDTLTGGAGTNSLLGGAGNDLLQEAVDQNITLTNSALLVNGNGKPDVAHSLTAIELAELSGGVSRNRIDLSGFTASLGATINGAGQNDTIIGSPGPDLIATLTGADSINGLGGADVVYSGSGNDTVNGGDGADNLNGQNGNDLVQGDAGADVLVGGVGIDTLTGGADNDFLSGQTDAGLLNGGDGNDILLGNSANDTLNGDAGDDRLTSLQGNDLLNGGVGADTLFAGSGNDSLSGGAGADDLRGEVGSDTIDGGADADRINEVFDVNVTITGQTISTAGLGNDVVTNVERVNVLGGPSSNLFDARAATVPILLLGDAGNDTLLGGSKSDILNGGDGDDVLSGAGSNDVLDGGSGTDYQMEKADANFVINGATIISTITGTDTPTNVERIVLIGGAGSNKLDATLASVPVILIGGRGNDTLLGGSATDTLSGGNRNDATVSGGDGTDSLDGGAGVDVLENDPADTRITGDGDTTVADVFTLLPSWVDAI